VLTAILPPDAFRPFAALLLAAFLLPSASEARKRPHRAGPAEGAPRSLAVLDPIDLVSGMPDEAAGAILRRAFLRISEWSVLPADSAARLLRGHGIDPGASCLEFQCAFAAGNALQTEFVLFGTTASLPETHAFSLGLVHIPGSQVVWSKAGASPPEAALGPEVADLRPSTLRLGKRPSAGILGILESGPSTPHSRVVVHRAISHAYAARIYDLLGPAEIGELMAALDPFGDAGADGGKRMPARQEAMQRLGREMGIRYLLGTRVHEGENGYRMEFAFQDVEKGRMLRYWPSRETGDFASLLDLESRFLEVLETGSPFPSPTPWEPPDPVRPGFWKPIAFAAATAAGAYLGYLSYRNAANADEAFRESRRAPSGQAADQARRKAGNRDERALRYGALGGLTVALGLAVWVF